MATKLRALLQRDKGRDLFDLDHALEIFPELDIGRLIAIFGRYLALRDQMISRAEAEQRMLAKFERPDLLGDLRPLFPPGLSGRLDDAAGRAAFLRVFRAVIERIPGQRWARTDEVALRLGLGEIVQTRP